MGKISRRDGYLSLCYHYLRPEKNKDAFPRILGNSREEFLRHLQMLGKQFCFIGEKEALEYSYDSRDYAKTHDKHGLLLTFDDGLSDHYWAAKVLKKMRIRGIFFIPTCIVANDEPANPIIIHYCIAEMGINAFLSACEKELGRTVLMTSEKNASSILEKIAQIKRFFKYELPFQKSRETLLRVYCELFLERHPNAMEIMHLTKKQIRHIAAMGHSIGVHSHTHISIAGSGLGAKDFKREVVLPKKHLEKLCKTAVVSLSYPFGSPQDSLSPEQLKSITNEYSLAFTVEEKVNRKDASPFDLGRYMPTSSDTESTLLEKLKSIIGQQS